MKSNKTYEKYENKKIKIHKSSYTLCCYKMPDNLLRFVLLHTGNDSFGMNSIPNKNILRLNIRIDKDDSIKKCSIFPGSATLVFDNPEKKTVKSILRDITFKTLYYSDRFKILNYLKDDAVPEELLKIIQHDVFKCDKFYDLDDTQRKDLIVGYIKTVISLFVKKTDISLDLYQLISICLYTRDKPYKFFTQIPSTSRKIKESDNESTHSDDVNVEKKSIHSPLQNLSIFSSSRDTIQTSQKIQTLINFVSSLPTP